MKLENPISHRAWLHWYIFDLGIRTSVTGLWAQLRALQKQTVSWEIAKRLKIRAALAKMQQGKKMRLNLVSICFLSYSSSYSSWIYLNIIFILLVVLYKTKTI